VQAVPDLEADIVQAAVHTARARGKVRFVKGVKKPRETPRPTAWAVRAWRQHRGLRDAEKRQRKKRKRDAQDEATGQRTDSPMPAEPARGKAALAGNPQGGHGTALAAGADRPGAGSPADSDVRRASCPGNGGSSISGEPPGPGGSGDPSTSATSSAQGRMVYDGKPEFEVRAAAPVAQHGELRSPRPEAAARSAGTPPGCKHSFAPGPPCENFCKSRVVVVGKCRGLGDFRTIAQTTGVLGCIVADFNEGAYALVFKERNREFRACEECYSLCAARVSHTIVQAACALFLSAPHIRDVELHRKGPAANEEMPDFEDACELLKDTSLGDFSALHANALKAKRYKRCTPLQEALLTYPADLKEFMHAKQDAESMIFKATSPGPHFLNNFKRATVLNMEGMHYENDGAIHITTLRDAISRPQSPTKPPLYLTKTLIFVGLAGGGKSEFMHALAREFCQRNGKACYGFSASIDPYGLMTKSGKMRDLGCVCLYDFTLTSRLDHLLGREEIKGLLYTKERAHVPARYHTAILYEWVPRIWSVNYGVDDRGQVDKTEWFTSQGLPALAALLRRDATAINSGGEHDKAIARRPVIFCVDENLFEESAQGATDAVGLEVWRAEQANATPLDG